MIKIPMVGLLICFGMNASAAVEVKVLPEVPFVISSSITIRCKNGTSLKVGPDWINPVFRVNNDNAETAVIRSVKLDITDSSGQSRSSTLVPTDCGLADFARIPGGQTQRFQVFVDLGRGPDFLYKIDYELLGWLEDAQGSPVQTIKLPGKFETR